MNDRCDDDDDESLDHDLPDFWFFWLRSGRVEERNSQRDDEVIE